MNIVVIKLITFKNNNNDGCKFTNFINNFLTKTLFIMLPNVIMRIGTLQARILVVFNNIF